MGYHSNSHRITVATATVNSEMDAIVVGYVSEIAPFPCSQKTDQAPSHVLDNIIAKFGALNLRSAIHQARKIVSDTFRGDGTIQALDDQIGDFAPTHIPEHHFALRTTLPGFTLSWFA